MYMEKEAKTHSSNYCRLSFVVCMYELSQTAYDQTSHRHHNHHNIIFDQWIQRTCYVRTSSLKPHDYSVKRCSSKRFLICMEWQEFRFHRVACRKIRGKFFKCFAHIVFLCCSHTACYALYPSAKQKPRAKSSPFANVRNQ